MDTSTPRGLQMEKLVRMTRKAAAASLAGGVIAAAGRSVSVERAMAIHRDIYFSLFPEPKNKNYQTWKQKFDAAKLVE
jgi:hypothetical protein